MWYTINSLVVTELIKYVEQLTASFVKHAAI